jgi:hypothetical protein
MKDNQFTTTMIPTSYKIINGETHFIYCLSELKQHIKSVKENGGRILVKRNGSIFTYKGFYTDKSKYIISIVHDPLFDGKILTDNEIIRKTT